MTIHLHCFISPRIGNLMTPVYWIWEFPAADCVAHGASFLEAFFCVTQESPHNGPVEKKPTPSKTNSSHHVSLKIAWDVCVSFWKNLLPNAILGTVFWVRGSPWWVICAKMLYLAARSTHWTFDLRFQGVANEKP